MTDMHVSYFADMHNLLQAYDYKVEIQGPDMQIAIWERPPVGDWVRRVVAILHTGGIDDDEWVLTLMGPDDHDLDEGWTCSSMMKLPLPKTPRQVHAPLSAVADWVHQLIERIT